MKKIINNLLDLRLGLRKCLNETEYTDAVTLIGIVDDTLKEINKINAKGQRPDNRVPNVKK